MYTIDTQSVKEKGLVIENFRHTIISNIIFRKELVSNIRIKASVKINDIISIAEFLVIDSEEHNILLVG